MHDSGDWEAWFKFFLRGVAETSDNALEMTNKIDNLITTKLDLISKRYPDGKTESPKKLLMCLFHKPIITASDAIEIIGRSKQLAYNYITDFEEMGILHEYTGQVRNKRFLFKDYLELLNRA